MEDRLDGNAAGGTLQEIFPFDMTIARVTCAGCGVTRRGGELVAYIPGLMGTILRCPECNNVLLKVVHAPGRYWLSMQGVRVLQVSTGPAS